MVQQSWLLVEVVEERVLGLCISQGGRKEDDKEGEKDYHPDRGQVGLTLTGGWESQPLYQADSSRRAPAFKSVQSPAGEFRHTANVSSKLFSKFEDENNF